MNERKLNKEEKRIVLQKYRDFVLATFDYYLENRVMQIKTADFDSQEHYKILKIQTKEHFNKGRLIRLKQ